MVIEIGRKYLRDFYDGNLKECVSAMDGVIWDENTIKQAFNFGNGTEEDFQRYMHDNKKYCIYVEVTK